MATPQAAIERALASPRVTEATRELLLDLFEGNRLGKEQQAALSAIAERATKLHEGTAPASSGKPADALGDNWFQCPHCAEVFEGETPACKACGKPLAAPRPALVIELDGATIWLSASAGDARPSGALVQRIDWLRVESGVRWFELLDERQRVEAERSAIALPPNVTAVARREGERTLLVHATKLEVHVVEGGTLRGYGKGSATELAVRELTEVLYPEAAPVPPSGKAIASKGHAQNPALEAAIEADIDRPEAFLVYADWLQAQGDPRGELIVLQHAHHDIPAHRHLMKHAHHFYGRLADAMPMLERYRGGGLGTDTWWRWGYLHALWISNKREVGPDVPEALAAMLDHPSCRFLRELTVGIVEYEDNSYGEVAAVIGERELPTLHTLTLGDFRSDETELNWSDTGDLEPIYSAVPNLRKLVVRSGSVKLGAIELPTLEELIVISGGLGRTALASILAASWPNLSRLSVELGQEGEITSEHLAPIFDAHRFPRVAHLGLGNSLQTDELARRLAVSKIAAQLVSLDLSESTLGDEGAQALVAGSFPRLERIAVRNCYLTGAGIAALQSLAKHVEAGEQRDDDGDPDERYIGAYE